MRDPARAVEVYTALSQEQQELFVSLIKRPGHRARVRELTGPGRWGSSGYEAQQDVLGLDAKGLVVMQLDQSWTDRRGPMVQIPGELTAAFLDILDLDNRERAEVISMRQALQAEGPAGLLAALPPQLRNRASRREDRFVRRMASFSRIHEEIESLPDAHLRHAVRLAMHGSCGIMLLSRFEQPLRSLIARHKKQWRRMLEKGLLGTIGRFSLVDLGINADGDHLVIFQENVAPYLQGEIIEAREHDRVESAGMDFVMDVCKLLSLVGGLDVRVTKQGRLYKSSARRVLEQLCQEGNCFNSREDLLHTKASLCERLHLIRIRSDGVIRPAPKAFVWTQKRVTEQIRSLVNAQINTHSTFRLDSPVDSFRKAVLSFVKEMRVGRWYHAAGLLFTPMSQWLLDATDQVGESDPGLPSAGAPHSSYHWSIPELSQQVLSGVLPTLVALGVVDAMVRGGRARAVRLTELGRRALTAGKPKADPSGRIVVNPTHEVVVFPEGDPIGVLDLIRPFCDYERSDIVFHLRISEQSVRRAAQRGAQADAMLETMRRFAQKGIPQNVEYSVREWAAMQANQ